MERGTSDGAYEPFTVGTNVGFFMVVGKALGAGVGCLEWRIEGSSVAFLKVGSCEGVEEGTIDGEEDGFSLSAKHVSARGSIIPGSYQEREWKEV